MCTQSRDNSTNYIGQADIAGFDLNKKAYNHQKHP